MKKSISQIFAIMVLTVFCSCCKNEPNCFLYRNWKVFNPLNNSMVIMKDTIKKDFVNELNVKKGFLDSLINKDYSILFDTNYKLNNNRLKFEAKNNINFNGKNVKVYKMFIYGKTGEILFFYSKEYGCLLKLFKRKTFFLENFVDSCDPSSIIHLEELSTKIYNDTILMPKTKIKF